MLLIHSDNTQERINFNQNNKQLSCRDTNCAVTNDKINPCQMALRLVLGKITHTNLVLRFEKFDTKCADRYDVKFESFNNSVVRHHLNFD